MRFLAPLLALCFIFLHAEEFSYSDEPVVQEKVLYVNYVNLPEQVFNGEIFPVTFKTLSTMDRFESINYDFSNGRGLKQLSKTPQRQIIGNYYFDTFYFQAISNSVRLPDVTVSLNFSQFTSNYATTLDGKSIEAISLNPNNGYAHILADTFTLTSTKTTRYDRNNNILVFSAMAQRCNLDDFSLNGYEKQGFESLQVSHDLSEMMYYVVIPRKYEELQFTYFDLTDKRFKNVLIPIMVDNDTVSTQSDLKPREHAHELIKMGVAGAVSIFGLIMLYLRRKLFYLVVLIVPLIYIAMAAIPIRYACIKQESPIYLLPMKNGTIFEKASAQYTLEVQGEIDGFTKVKLQNNKIGWVKNEDLCTP
jgi:hypothetical protein